MADRIPMSIRGMGSALPERVMTNADFEQLVDTSDEWIRTRTGIRERRIADEDQDTLTLSVDASRKALADAGLSAEDIDLIVVATSTPVVPMPATACFLQHELGCRHVGAFDLQAACSGFVYAFVNAAHMMLSGRYRHVLVVGAETMSRVTDFDDRGTCILLGDGAGAMILSPPDNPVSGLYDYCLHADGSGAPMIWVPAGGSREPASQRTVNERLHYLKMKGREVYRFAVTRMQEVITDTMERAGITVEDIGLIVPHQSNLRIIESAAEKLGLAPEKLAINIERYGNTSAASIPLALEEARRAGRIKDGDWVMLAGFGAGLTWGSALLRV
jgi:3-oxoacyl-[acyl-carrier-protein] synthase III